MKLNFVFFIVFVCLASGVKSRVPPRDQRETEEVAPVENKPKDDVPIATPVERSPIDNPDSNDDQIANRPPNRKPISVILFRQQPSFSLFSNRAHNPFMGSFNSPFDHSPLDHSHHFNNFNNGNLHNDPAIRLISLLLGNGQRMRPIQPEADDETASSESTSAGSSDDSPKEAHPFDSIFPSIFPRFPVDDEKPTGSESEDKTPSNYENKEKKVVNIGGRKFVKTVQVKKVKNDFGQFHSVISSYQPFDEKIHDENGNEKIVPKPDESADDQITSSVGKKQVTESSTEKSVVDSSTPSSEDKVVSPLVIVDDKVSSVDSSSSSTPSTEKEESTESPDMKPIETSEPEKIKIPAESLSKDVDESKNEIPDKNAEIKEIKVDQMN